MKRHYLFTTIFMGFVLCSGCGGSSGTTSSGSSGSGLLDPGTSVGTIINNPAQLTVNSLAVQWSDVLFLGSTQDLEAASFGFVASGTQVDQIQSIEDLTVLVEAIRGVSNEYSQVLGLSDFFRKAGVTNFTEETVIIPFTEGALFAQAEARVDLVSPQTLRVNLRGWDNKVYGTYVLVVDDAGQPSRGLYVAVNPNNTTDALGLAFSLSTTSHRMVVRRIAVDPNAGSDVASLDYFACDPLTQECVAEHLQNTTVNLRYSWSQSDSIFCTARIFYEEGVQRLLSPVQLVASGDTVTHTECTQPEPYWEEKIFTSEDILSASALRNALSPDGSAAALEVYNAETITQWLEEFVYE